MNDDVRKTDYLNKPYSQATLGEHAEYNRRDRCRLPSEADVRDFLGVDFDKLVSREKWIPTYDLPQVFRALNACFPGWQFSGERGDISQYRLKCPSWRRFETRPGEYEEHLTEGLRFYRLPDNQRRVVLVEPEASDESLQGYIIGIIARSGDRAAVAAESDKLWRWVESNHYLQGQSLRPGGTLLPRQRGLSWEDVALPPNIRETIQRNTVELLKLRQVYQDNGIPLTRGILLHGPPGSGKTLIGKVLANDPAATLIYATAADAEHLSELRHLFRLARRLRPAIVFLEDLDLFAFDRTSSGMAGSMGELLAQLDGFEKNDGLICVATTNDLEAIEPALKDRPSRFDVVLEIGLPNDSSRRRILELNLRETILEPQLLHDIATETKGLSGAQIREVAYLIVQGAITRGALNGQGRVQPTRSDAEAAVAQILKGKKSGLGFQAVSRGEEEARGAQLQSASVA